MILKQFDALSRQDLAEHPVWVQVSTTDYEEPWYEECDEATYRAWTGDLPVSQDCIHIVRSACLLADGRELPGFVTPQYTGSMVDFGMAQPHLFLPSGTLVGFWEGALPNRSLRRKFYDELCQRPVDIFPIQFAVEPGLTAGKELVYKTMGFYVILENDHVRVEW